jgi:copper transport protein
MHWLRRAAVILAVLAGGVAALPGAAHAHAYLASSAPADGSIVDRAPEAVTLSFTEHVELSATHVDIVDGDGRRWAPTAMVLRTTDSAEEGDTESPVDVVIGLPPNLPPNVYHVAWRTLSSDDLHTTNGTLVFGVQRQVAASAQPKPAGPGIRESVIRAAGLVGMSTLLGGVALAALLGVVRRRDLEAPARLDALGQRLLRVAVVAGGIAIVCLPVQLTVQLGADGGDWGRLLAGQLGSAHFLVRAGGLLLLTGAAAWVLRTGRAMDSRDPLIQRAAIAGAVGALLAGAGTALSGHRIGTPLTTVLLIGAHVLAAGGWAGSVVAAAAALLPLLRAVPHRGAQIRSLLRAFAMLAIACVATLAVSGLLLTGVQVATWDALLTTPYGLILVAKVLIAAAAGMLGLRTSLRLRRRDEIAGRRLRMEAALLVGVLVLAAAMASAGPARGPAFPVGTASVAVPEVSGQAADLVDTLTVRPNRPGRNVLTITVADTRRPSPGRYTGMSVQLMSPDGRATIYPVSPGDQGWTIAVDDINVAGTWRIAVTVLRTGMSPATDIHDWVVPAATADPAGVVVSAAPVRPVTTALAVFVAAGVLFAVGVWWRRRRRALVRLNAAPDEQSEDELDPLREPELVSARSRRP